MPGASALTIEPVLKAAQKTKYGLPKHIPLPLSSWTLNTGVVLAAVGAGSAGNANAATNLACIQWDDTADQTDIIRCSIVLPPDFRTSIDGNSPKIVLYVKARVLDGTGSATANTNLALQADAYWHKTGDADLSTHSAVVSNVIGAVDYTASQENGFALYKFDLTTNMSAAQLLSRRSEPICTSRSFTPSWSMTLMLRFRLMLSALLAIENECKANQFNFPSGACQTLSRIFSNPATLPGLKLCGMFASMRMAKPPQQWGREKD